MHVFRSTFGGHRPRTTEGASGSSAGRSGACSTEPEEPLAPAETDGSSTCSAAVGQVPPHITRQRAGVYTITDAVGRQVGSIRGDTVIGFTTQYAGRLWRFGSLEQAEAAICGVD